MNSYGLCLALVAVAVVGLAPAHAQLADHVVINEVDTNPRGDDRASVSEWVELYNPTDSFVDLSGWEITSNITKKTLVLQPGNLLEPGQLAAFQYQTHWFSDLSESVELRSPDGKLVDKTPLLTDREDDFTSWQRLYDGYAPNTINDWKFVTSNAGSSNGKLLEVEEVETASVSVSVDKDFYLFGEKAVISGNVSEIVTLVKPSFGSAPIVVTITGPSYENEIVLHPRADLTYKTELDLKRVLGVGKGMFEVSVSYHDAPVVGTGFEVSDRPQVVVVAEEFTVEINTDKPAYVPGETLVMTGTANKVLPFKGMQFEVYDPDENLMIGGNIFPIDGVFSTRVFLPQISPVYGTYEIKATYGEKSVTATFEVEKVAGGGAPISISTNQTAYGIGDVVSISGMLNKVWALDLDVIINQIKLSHLRDTEGFFVRDTIKPNGDGSFTYIFNIPNYDTGLGDYLVHISGSGGTADLVIPVVEDPENFIKQLKPLTIMLDAESYEIGQTAIISGRILDLTHTSQDLTKEIDISIIRDDGTPLQIIKLNPKFESRAGESIDYSIKIFPDVAGKYENKLDISRSIFDPDTYVLFARYFDAIASTTFTVTDQFDLDDNVITTDKNVYGLGQTVKLTGILPTVVSNTANIVLTIPDGTSIPYVIPIEGHHISWEWDIPATETSVTSSADIGGGDPRSSNLGIYRILVSYDDKTISKNFKVSLTPDTDTLEIAGLEIATDKALYKVGERLQVSGNINSERAAAENALDVATILVYKISPYEEIHTSVLFPGSDGSLSATFELPFTDFEPGTYGVRAIYSGDNAISVFTMGTGEDLLSIKPDKKQYLPGSDVIITGTGGPDTGRLDIGTILESDSAAICGLNVCGSQIGIKRSLSLDSGTFENIISLDDDSPLGTYEVLAVYGSFVESATFEVVEEVQADSSPRTIIQKENRITEKEIVIEVAKKEIDGEVASPRVVSGSMVVNQGAESAENLRVVTESGICIIGPGDCLVSESTRKTGQIYEVIEADGVSYNVRYSGPDVRLEKFSIVPEDSEQFLPDSTWDVVVDGGDSSRFYYKITYKTS